MSTLAANVQTQNGMQRVTPPTNANWTTVSVTFSPQFTVVPIVTATTINEAKLPDAFAVTVYDVTAQGFSANVYRVDNLINVIKGGDPEGWGQQNLQLGWIAQAS
jgi:hypothetical protein